MKEKKKKIKIGKLVIKDMKRFCISIAIFLLAILVICILISNIGKKDVGSISDLSSINADKNSVELLSKYEESGMKEVFVSDYQSIQNYVGMYIMNNSTTDENSFKNIVSDLNKKLNKEKWEESLGEKPITWNGTWSVNDEGVVKFKFATKKIEPNWLKNTDISTKIIFN